MLIIIRNNFSYFFLISAPSVCVCQGQQGGVFFVYFGVSKNRLTLRRVKRGEDIAAVSFGGVRCGRIRRHNPDENAY